MFSLFDRPEPTFGIDTIDEMDFLYSSSTLFDDLNSPWDPLLDEPIDSGNEFSPVSAATPISFATDFEYPSSPYFIPSPLSDTPSLCSTPSPTINPLQLIASSPSSACSSDIWSPMTPKSQSPELPPALLSAFETHEDVFGKPCIKKRDLDDLMDLEDDESILEVLPVERERPARRAKLFHLSYDDSDDDDKDDTFVPEEDDYPPAKRQNVERSSSPESVSPSPKPRRSKISHTCSGEKMHYCPLAKCHFQSERHSDVERHYKSVHEKVRFACPVCDKKLTRRDAVKRHQEAGDACAKALRKKAKLLQKQRLH